MNILGFKYCQRKKGYYVDGHEKPATVEYRRKFVQRYLKYERRAHRWIQITLEESKKLEREEIIPVRSGYYYMTGKSWIGPNGEKAISPKDEGQGVMISAFQSRHDGFGMDLSLSSSNSA